MGLESRHKEEEADTESHYCRIRKQFGLEEPTHSMLNTHPGSAPLPWKHALQTSSHMLHQHRESSREYLSIDWFYNILHKVFTLGWDVKVGMLVKSWQSEMENRFSHSVFLPVSQLSAGTQSTDVEPKMKQGSKVPSLDWFHVQRVTFLAAMITKNHWLWGIFTCLKQINQVGQIIPGGDTWCHFDQPVLEWHVTTVFTLTLFHSGTFQPHV